MDDLFHKLEGRVRGTEISDSAAEVSRRSIGDYAKEINTKLEGRLHEQ